MSPCMICIWSGRELSGHELEVGLSNPGNAFFTVFQFSEREFDTIFKMGDSAQVLDGLRKLAHKSQHYAIKDAFAEMGWQVEPTPASSSDQMQSAI